MQNQKISVIIATKDRKEELLRFIESLNQQTVFPDEFIIVDASDKPFESDIKKAVNHDYKLKYVKAEPGLTKQRNIGIQESNGDVLCFFDDDIVLEKDYLFVLKSSFEKSSEIGGFSGKITNLNIKINWRFKLQQFLYKLWLLPYFNNKGIIRKSFAATNYHLGKQEQFIEWTSGCCMAFTKKALQEVGGFDEKLSTYCYMEDMDVSYRISRKYKILYNPLAKCLHNESPANRLKEVEKGKMFAINHKYLHKKNMPKRIDYQLAFLIAVFFQLFTNLYNGNIRKLKGLLSGI